MTIASPQLRRPLTKSRSPLVRRFAPSSGAGNSGGRELSRSDPDRALIQLAAGVGKIYLIANICARLLGSGRYHRILIVTDTLLGGEQIAEPLSTSLNLLRMLLGRRVTGRVSGAGTFWDSKHLGRHDSAPFA